MKDVRSMTEVNSEDISAAVKTFRFYKDKHEKELEQSFEDWKSTLKPSWFGARRNLHLKTGRQVFNKMYENYGYFGKTTLLTAFGIWRPSYDYTIGTYYESYDHILNKLLKSPEETHLLDYNLVGWVFKWNDYTEEDE